jgi:hypothetical protein
MEARPEMRACWLKRCQAAAPPSRDSDCWAECYMESLLGPNASTPHTGMSAAEITSLWLQPFSEPAVGGCPDIKRGRTHLVAAISS